ncbi:hypothetical protein C8R43DRAFT_963631 [Mycena crocata]|nr:hypothetical protein C8R43DRAFT_963631 [Mycena crocata]
MSTTSSSMPTTSSTTSLIAGGGNDLDDDNRLLLVPTPAASPSSSPTASSKSAPSRGVFGLRPRPRYLRRRRRPQHALGTVGAPRHSAPASACCNASTMRSPTPAAHFGSDGAQAFVGLIWVPALSTISPRSPPSIARFGSNRELDWFRASVSFLRHLAAPERTPALTYSVAQKHSTAPLSMPVGNFAGFQQQDLRVRNFASNHELRFNEHLNYHKTFVTWRFLETSDFLKRHSSNLLEFHQVLGWDFVCRKAVTIFKTEDGPLLSTVAQRPGLYPLHTTRGTSVSSIVSGSLMDVYQCHYFIKSFKTSTQLWLNYTLVLLLSGAEVLRPPLTFNHDAIPGLGLDKLFFHRNLNTRVPKWPEDITTELTFQLPFSQMSTSHQHQHPNPDSTFQSTFRVPDSIHKSIQFKTSIQASSISCPRSNSLPNVSFTSSATPLTPQSLLRVYWDLRRRSPHQNETLCAQDAVNIPISVYFEISLVWLWLLQDTWAFKPASASQARLSPSILDSSSNSNLVLSVFRAGRDCPDGLLESLRLHTTLHTRFAVRDLWYRDSGVIFFSVHFNKPNLAIGWLARRERSARIVFFVGQDVLYTVYSGLGAMSRVFFCAGVQPAEVFELVWTWGLSIILRDLWNFAELKSRSKEGIDSTHRTLPASGQAVGMIFQIFTKLEADGFYKLRFPCSNASKWTASARDNGRARRYSPEDAEARDCARSTVSFVFPRRVRSGCDETANATRGTEERRQWLRRGSRLSVAAGRKNERLVQTAWVSNAAGVGGETSKGTCWRCEREEGRRVGHISEGVCSGPPGCGVREQRAGGGSVGQAAWQTRQGDVERER